MSHATAQATANQEIPLPIDPGDIIVGDDVEIEFKTYVEETALVRFYDQFGREQQDGLASFKEWLAAQDELTIERDEH
jgi:hypothetical protein